MDWIAELLSLVLERGIGAAFLVALTVFLVQLAVGSAKILTDNCTKLVAETAWRTIANWTVAVAAVVIARWSPSAAEALDEQLEWLDRYQNDGLTGFKLVRQAVAFALHMQATADGKQRAAANRVPLQGADGVAADGSGDLTVEDTAVTGTLDVTQDDQTMPGRGRVFAEDLTVEIVSDVTAKDSMSAQIGPALVFEVAMPVRAVGGRPNDQQ